MKRRIVILVCGALLIGIVGAALFLRFPPRSEDISWEKPQRAELLKMADSLSANLHPWQVPDKICKVEDYGAVADASSANTISIQKAIDDCSAIGGGVVLFSKGDYVTGTIELRSGVMIEVDRNSRILGSTDLRDYPEKIEQFKSVMSENHRYRQSLIYAEKCDRVGIRGEGEIDFRGEKENFPVQENSGKENRSEIVGRPLGIRMIQCSNVYLHGITLRNAAAWMQSYLDCKDLIFDGMTVQNQANLNNDGLDLDGCTNVIVRNCDISSEDDAMCLKGASNRPSENILIERSTFVSSCNALKIGTDTQGDFRNIVARDLKLGGIPESMIAIHGHQAIAGITLATVDGGNVENILISGVSIDRTRCPVFIAVGDRSSVMPGAATPPVGYLKKIVIENVTGEGDLRQGSLITGINGHYVEDIIIRNYRISATGGGDASLVGLPVAELGKDYPDAKFFSPDGLPSYGFYIRHARRINFIDTVDTTMSPDARPLFLSGGDTNGVIVNGKNLN